MAPDDDAPLIELARIDVSTASSDLRSDIRIFDDGRVTLDPRFSIDGPPSSTRDRLASDALAELKRRVFVTLDVWSIDIGTIERAIGKELEASGAESPESITVLGADVVADAATTVIRIDDGTRRRELRFYNLAGAAARHPDIESLQRLRAVETTLLELAQRLGTE